MHTSSKQSIKVILISLLLFQVSISRGQHTDIDKNVSSLDHIITALYASISGEKGEPRDWEKFRKLFTEEAKLIPIGIDSTGNIRLGTWTPDQYVQNADSSLVQNGFHENEIYRVTETFGNLTHIFSTYESRHSKYDKEPFSRGINSIQLLNDGKRWWVVNIYWLSETEKKPIPPKYLPN